MGSIHIIGWSRFEKWADSYNLFASIDAEANAVTAVVKALKWEQSALLFGAGLVDFEM